MSKRSGYHNITEKEFWRIKALLEEELPRKEAVRKSKRSPSTVYHIKMSKDFQDYKYRVAHLLWLEGHETPSKTQYKPQNSLITPKPVTLPILPKNRAEIVCNCVLACVVVVCVTIVIVASIITFGGKLC